MNGERTSPDEPQVAAHRAPEAVDPQAPAVRATGPTLALVGRTNVGKSTLFNRLTGGKRALVAPSPGLTRDRREGRVRRGPYRFRVVDTGGMEFDREAAFGEAIAAQVEQALAGAAAVWLVVDAKAGLTPLDERLYRWLEQRGTPVWLVVNRVDHGGRELDAAEFYGLGAARLFPVSAQHGRGLESLLEDTAAAIPDMLAGPEPAPDTGAPIRVALLGKPNVGKSSLVNRILGAGRMIVSEIPGTTREPVDVPLEVDGERFVLIDTAGLRRRARTKEALEKIGALTTLGALERTDVAVLVLDAGEPISEQDAKIAGHILKSGRAVVGALNKWDRVPREAEREVTADIRHRLRFLEFAPMVRVSAVDGRGIDRLFHTVREAYAQFTRQIQTADLNRIITPTVLNRPPPAAGRSATKVHYGTQVAARPPTFWFFTNHPQQITPAYTRYFANQLRYHFGLEGTPLVIRWKGRDETGSRPARSPSRRKKAAAEGKAPPAKARGKAASPRPKPKKRARR